MTKYEILEKICIFCRFKRHCYFPCPKAIVLRFVKNKPKRRNKKAKVLRFVKNKPKRRNKK